MLINNDFLKHKQANINVKSRRFGIIMTQFSRQKDIEKRGNWLPKIIKESKNLRSQENGLSSGSILNLYYDYFGDSWGYDSRLARQLNAVSKCRRFYKIGLVNFLQYNKPGRRLLWL